MYYSDKLDREIGLSDFSYDGSYNHGGDIYEIPDYYGEFPRRFIRRFDITDRFKKAFPDIKRIDDVEVDFTEFY